TARPTDVVIGELVIVGLTPDRDEVGYPELRFVYRCDTHGPARIATYALDEGRFVLLATTDVLGDEELPAELAGPAAAPGAPQVSPRACRAATPRRTDPPTPRPRRARPPD